MPRATSHEPRATSVRLPACRSSRSPSSRKNEAADIAAALHRRRWADEIDRRRLRRAPTTRWRSPRRSPIAWSSASGPAMPRRRITRPRSPATTGSCSLDADERVTPALAAEIQQALARAARHAAFRIPRVTWHLGRWIPTTGLVSRPPAAALRPAGGAVDRPLRPRVVDRRAAAIGRLRGELQHYAYRDIADHLETIDRYTTLRARARCTRTAAAPAGCRSPATRRSRFLRNYIAQGGFTRRRRRASSSRR